MRLLTKTTLYFIAAIIPLLVIAGIFLYHQFNAELRHRLDQELLTAEFQWINFLKQKAREGSTFILKTEDIIIFPTDQKVTSDPLFATTSGFDVRLNREGSFRQITDIVPIAGIPYLITIRQSLEQRTMFAENITRLLLIVFIALLLITIVVNGLINMFAWRPFKRSLQKIRSAELQKMEAFHFERTSTKEFNELNESLNLMAEKIQQDYISMKEFTENAAHEMQTPVAVVQSKLELVLQDTSLKNEQVNYIIQASEALTRLSKLNQALLLLAKIENHQFATTERISLVEVTSKYLKFFNEIITDKQIQTDTNFTGDWNINLHPILADSLISNLLGNAIKYNYQTGLIKITITENQFSISNTSSGSPIDASSIFKRFNKAKDHHSNSTGLGLAIVKKICDTHKLDIKYSSDNYFHNFTIQPKDVV